MMEPVKTPTMHLTETKTICSTLSYAKNGDDESTKKLENELLYGADDDGDEDDALSDDSLRLRLSDDEEDASPAASCSEENQLKSIKTECPDSNAPETEACENGLDGNEILNDNPDNESDNNNIIISETNTKLPDNNDDISQPPLVQIHHDLPSITANSPTINNVKEDLKQNENIDENNDNDNEIIPSTNANIDDNDNDKEDKTDEDENKIELSAVGSNDDNQDDNDKIEKIDKIDKIVKIDKIDNNDCIQKVEENLKSEDLDKEVNVDESLEENTEDIQNEGLDETEMKEIHSPLPTQEQEQEHVSAVPDENVSQQHDDFEINDENIDNIEPTKPPDMLQDDVLEDDNDGNDVANNDHDDDDNVTMADAGVEGEKDKEEEEVEKIGGNTEKNEMEKETEAEEKKVGVGAEEKEEVVEEDKIIKIEISDKKMDDIALKQDIVKVDEEKVVIEKTSNKRRLSVSDDDETNACKRILCQETVADSPNSYTIKENVKIEIAKMLETDEKKDDIVDSSVKIDNLNSDSCGANNTTDGENILDLPMDISVDEDNSNLTKDENNVKPKENDEDQSEPPKGKRRRRKRKASSPSNLINQEKENVGRQKRETAQKAQEMIKKLNDESDPDTDDPDDRIYYICKQRNLSVQPLSPPSLTRPIGESEESLDGMIKKPNSDNVIESTTDVVEPLTASKKLEHVRKFFLRDNKQKLARLTQEQLEELLIQKVIETITMRDEIGRLREQAKISERTQEATKAKCQQLAKQIKDFEMVLSRFAADRRANDKLATPIKINRSVGLQVSFVSEPGIQNLRQLQNAKPNILTNGPNVPSKLNEDPARKGGIKVRSPRRPEAPVIPPPAATMPAVNNVPISIQTPVTTIPPSPATIVAAKTVDSRQTVIATTAPQIVNQVLSNQAITLNGVQIQNANRQTKMLNVRINDNNNANNNTTITINGNNTSSNSSSSSGNNNNNINNKNNNNENLIDLTGEEEKNRQPPPLSAIPIQPKDPNQLVPKGPPRYQRIVQSAPANVTAIPQSAIRVIQPGEKGAPTAIVNNMNGPRLTFVMKPGVGQHQLLITNPNQIRPVVNATPRPTFSGIATYTGLQTLPNGSVRVLPATAVTQAQKSKHPAALPAVTNYPINPSLKLPPPAPSLKISKVANGIVLSWNMALSDRYAEIASYQLYAYQEITGMTPSTTMWKKVGDVRALALPMACTLTQFSEGNNYYFAVRAVDTHSRLGQYSQPASISL